MALQSRIFPTIPGNNSIAHFSLFGARILGVARSTDIHNEIFPFVTPTSLEFYRVGSLIVFDPSNPFNLGETVWVLYE